MLKTKKADQIGLKFKNLHQKQNKYIKPNPETHYEKKTSVKKKN